MEMNDMVKLCFEDFGRVSINFNNGNHVNHNGKINGNGKLKEIGKN